MGDQLRSALLAGFIAGFVWLFITGFTTIDRHTAALIGLVFLVVGAAVTALVSTVIGRSRSRR